VVKPGVIQEELSLELSAYDLLDKRKKHSRTRRKKEEGLTRAVNSAVAASQANGDACSEVAVVTVAMGENHPSHPAHFLQSFRQRLRKTW